MVTMTTEISRPILKAVTAWIFAMLTSLWHSFSTIPWDKFAQFAAFVYSLCLIYEYLKKKWAQSKESPPHGTN